MESLEVPCTLFGGIMQRCTSYAPEMRFALPANCCPAGLSPHNGCPLRASELREVHPFVELLPKPDALCHYSEKGRPHYDVVKMFRFLILQTLYVQSDEDMEFNLYVVLSFPQFVVIGVMDEVPDTRTIWMFQQRFVSNGGETLQGICPHDAGTGPDLL